MGLRPKKLAVMLAILLILLGLLPASMKIAFPESVGGKIDLYTQKEPYSGIGPNMPSDAFGPGEEVQICALVTYNDEPLQNLLVAFEIYGPANLVKNITSYRVAFTNERGIAAISFRISHLNETILGKWTAIGNVEIAERTYQDSISFEVGWIVEIVSMRTINQDFINQENFTRESIVGIELFLRNIAMTEKIATLTVTIYDCLDVYINSGEINNFKVPPNGTLVQTYFFLPIPKSACLGQAIVYACAYTSSIALNGTPYCPEVATSFFIIPNKYTLTITASVGGTTSPLPGSYIYNEGTSVQVTAISNANYMFDHWELDSVDVGSVSPYSVYMDRNHTLKAVFRQIPSHEFVPNWFLWFWLPFSIILALLFILLIILYRRRKKKETQAFYSGWTAWYYCYDLRKRIH